MFVEPYHEVALLLLVSAAAVNDLATRRIPNRLLGAGLAGAGTLCVLSDAPVAALWTALTGLATGFGLLLPFYLLRGMAAGDVKLMAVVGTFGTLDDVLWTVVLAWCVGGAMAVLAVLARGRLGLALANMKYLLAGVAVPGNGAAALAPQRSAGSIPYGVAIAVGTLVVLLRHYA